MNAFENLSKLGLSLPHPSTPGGTYVSVNVVKSVAYVAIQFPILNDDYLYRGRLGNELSTEDGYKAAQLCALNVLAQINKYIGFDNILSLNHMDAYFQSVESWDNSPIVVNGASDLFAHVLERAGRHTHAIFGVERLPRNFSVGITTSFTLKN